MTLATSSLRVGDLAVFCSGMDSAPVQELLKIFLASNQEAAYLAEPGMATPADVQGSKAAALLITSADLPQVMQLTRSFVDLAVAAGVQRLAWVAPACPEVGIGVSLAAAEAVVRSTNLEVLILRHAPLFSDLLQYKKELKFRRTLSLPLGDRPLPWLAPETLAATLYQWVVGERTEPPTVLTGPDLLTGKQIADGLSQVLKQNANGVTYAQQRFALIDLDQSGQLDRSELFPYLLELGYSDQEAQTILAEADTDQSGTIEFEEFIQGLREHLDKILADVPTEIRYFNAPKFTALQDLIMGGMQESAATAWLEWLELLDQHGLPEQSPVVASPNRSLSDWAASYALDLINVHILPGRGILTISEGQFEGHPALITRILQANDRLLTSRRTLDGKSLEMQQEGIDPSTLEVVKYQPQENEERSLKLQDGRIVGLSVRGGWRGMQRATSLFFKGEPLPRWQVTLFRELGELQIEEVATTGSPEDVLCNCVQATCGFLQNLIDSGTNTLEKLADSTQVTMVCGGCTPLIEELLGSASLAVGELVAKVPLGANLVKFELRPVDQPVVASKPGQHILIQGRINGRWVTRAYTLSSPADQTEIYEVTIKREEMGEFSRWLVDYANSESLLRISSPRGEFVLEHETPVVFFAAGIGITPAIAMMRTLARRGDTRPFHLDWSAPHPEGFVFKQELEQLAHSHPTLTYTLRATRTSGRLNTEIVQECYPWTEETVAFMCGPEVYMDGVRSCLKECGWADAAIRQELFSSTLDDDGKAEKAPTSRLAQSTSGLSFVEQDSFSVEPIGSVLLEAEAFLKQCYIERGLSEVFIPRWQEVKDAIARTGTYEHTFDELAYGAKLAWRNSSRCVGRNFWQNLNLRDMRHLETEAEMFQAILEHIKLATNGGDLRAVITVFKPDGRRVWSPQYFRYAGYRQSDGSILGDPANVELTDVALSLGWKGGPGTRFDYLPIILQLPGKEPQWFELPPELIQEVPLSHPRYDWFEELELKWYSIPAVANMAFDIGGIQYTAAPFNGFYLSTEIGASNFAETGRYYTLPEIAKRMGLDCSQNMTLWKDLAMVELNVAVLHSYKQHGVRLLDHHTITETFVTFAKDEEQCGRTLYADWGWVVPPMSASLTPLFKMEMTNRILKPNYFYQPDPWKTATTPSGCPFH
jgi:nitric-oxide synthase